MVKVCPHCKREQAYPRKHNDIPICCYCEEELPEEDKKPQGPYLKGFDSYGRSKHGRS